MKSIKETIATELQNQAYVSGKAEVFFNPALISSDSWQDFSDSWDDLGQDLYMADGGTYRYRHFSEFKLETSKRQLTPLSQRSYSQTEENNYLNGGIDRHFPEILSDVSNHEVFQNVILGCGDILHQLHPDASWLVQIFQCRILARPSIEGKPTPEGVHRDGADYVISWLLRRHNIVGGASSTYNADNSEQPINTLVLEQPGDFILLDDNRTKHGVEPIRCVNEEENGYRDVLVALFTQIKA